MLCYKDRVYCPYGLSCKSGVTCNRVLSDEEKEKGEGYEPVGLPIYYYTDYPECFIPFADGRE